MTTAEPHHNLGMYIIERERPQQLPSSSMLGTGCSYAIPVRTSAPGGNAMCMNVAQSALHGNRCQ
jgi:hypothetical protein